MRKIHWIHVLPAILFYYQLIFHNHFPPVTSQKISNTKSPKNVCVPLVSCPAHIRIAKNTFCTTKIGKKGVMCKTGHNHTGLDEESFRSNSKVNLDQKTLDIISSKIPDSWTDLFTRNGLLVNSLNRSTLLKPGDPRYGHFRNSLRFDDADNDRVFRLSAKAFKNTLATLAVRDRFGLNAEDFEVGPDFHACPDDNSDISCDIHEKYRTIDGVCNNRDSPSSGAAFSAFSRLLPPKYHDGIWQPRRSVIPGRHLPSARVVSMLITDNKDRYSVDITQMFMQFGQFIAHDVTHSVDFTHVNGTPISCCTQNHPNELPLEHQHFACMPIKIPRNDRFYLSEFHQQCMNFVRSVLAPRRGCTLGYAQQLNKVTHFVDGSHIYGSTVEQIGALRTFKGGLMNVFEDFGRELLPLNQDRTACLTTEEGSACFQAGDTRCNQHITLVAIHTLFLREHNRIARVLLDLNPHWTDERLFLETRNVVIAEIQNILYREFLPILLGEETMREFDLLLSNQQEFASEYDPSVDPSIINEFAAAAYRFGHSIVDGRIKIFGPERLEEIISLPEVMFYPSRMRQTKFLDELLSTLTTEPIQEVDTSFTDALSKYMFRGGNPFGVDLISLNIQRGRDHGLRPYNEYRVLTGQERIEGFEEFGNEIGEKLRKIYASVDDIDLYIGGLLEPKHLDSIVGKTFRDIIAEQFRRLKFGDRYFFEHNGSSFTPEQIQEIRKSSMSRIVCDNSDKVLLARLAINAFKIPGIERNNPLVECSSNDIPKVNLEYWREDFF